MPRAKHPFTMSTGSGQQVRDWPEIVAMLRRWEPELRACGSDWQGGIPGYARFCMLRVANAMLRVLDRESQPSPESSAPDHLAEDELRAPLAPLQAIPDAGGRLFVHAQIVAAGVHLEPKALNGCSTCIQPVQEGA